MDDSNKDKSVVNLVSDADSSMLNGRPMIFQVLIISLCMGQNCTAIAMETCDKSREPRTHNKEC